MLLPIYDCAHYTSLMHNGQARFEWGQARGTLAVRSATGETASSVSRGLIGWRLPVSVSCWRESPDYCYFI
jgi:hypothetical protein